MERDEQLGTKEPRFDSGSVNSWWLNFTCGSMYNIVIISRTHIQQVLLLVALLLVIAHRADEPVACYGHGCPPDPVVAMFVSMLPGGKLWSTWVVPLLRLACISQW